MHIAAVKRPGTWIHMSNSESRRQTESLCRFLEVNVADAAVALNQFDLARRDAVDERKAHDIAARIRGEIYDAYRPDPALPQEDSLAHLQDEIRRAVLDERASRGLMPSDYEHRLPFMHARSFLFAFDYIAKMLTTLAEMDGAPPALSALCDEWAARFPGVHGVRNTAHHLEDRARGLGVRGKPLATSFVFLENLHHHSDGSATFSSTTSDGSVGEVVISADALAKAADIVNRCLASYTWSGIANISPTT